MASLTDPKRLQPEVVNIIDGAVSGRAGHDGNEPGSAENTETSLRVLVCGGRDYLYTHRVWETLDAIDVETPIATIIEGGATGADRSAFDWAVRRLKGVDSYKAEWRKHGKAAGPIRNQRMLDYGRPDLVIAFPGGDGTADMVRRAKAAGVKVVEIASPSLPDRRAV